MWEQFASCNHYIDVAWLLPKMSPICSCPRFANYFSIFGLVMSLQSFGINIYLLQGLFAVVDLPFYFLGFWAVKSLGRKPTQMASLLLSGIFILAYAMIPLGEYVPHSCSCPGPSTDPAPNLVQTSYLEGEKTQGSSKLFPVPSHHLHFLPDQSFLRTTMAVLGKGCITGSINCLSIYTSELYPTVMRWVGCVGGDLR